MFVNHHWVFQKGIFFSVRGRASETENFCERYIFLIVDVKYFKIIA